jgi:methylated-DNA-[protein]-cysteine S-methyltransferase
MLLKHTYSSPIGNIGLLIEDLNLISISLTNPVLKGIEAKKDPESFKYIITQLDEYFFEGRKKFDITFKISPTNFRLKVYQEMQKIPYGKSITYSDLAGKVGSPKAFRAVGTACGKNPLPLIIPCHRVKAQSGLGGFTGGLDIKRFLLNLERN